MSAKSDQQIATHVSFVTMAGNGVLTALKLAAGIVAHSGAMISDAIHSASDVLSTIVVVIGVRLAGRDSDKDHPYGHERLECVAAVILAVMLALTGAGIGWSGLQKIFNADSSQLTVPGALALVAAVVSIISKEAMYWYTAIHAKRINSGALMADAWHHRSDALSSVGSFVGILGARLGFPILDPIASVVICLFVLKAAYDIFADAVQKMTDTACDDATQAAIRDVVLQQSGVLGIDQLKTRLFGNRIYVDLEILADGNKTLLETHDTAQQVHDVIEGTFPNVKHCMVHVNPKE
jgi:cation diffusion facilitator family transporter